ncbi:MAG: multidrug ABC transporter ATP-binding protein [Deltaproteobacteria bacterium RBG_13_52_11b]|nr:MAG: multidrug ABC transporter ATP-binding protein [Deltaproteobacteria bacterium RBG_13_52_11b]
MEGQLIIEAEELTKVYDSRTAVDHLTLKVQEGEVFGFLGPNGAGKTTTLLMFLGLTEPTSGKVRVCGLDPARDPIHVKRQVGYLPENVGFYDDMDARQNVQYVARLNRIPDEVSSKRIDELLKAVGLSEEAHKKVGAYSKGMRQRLGIAEVLVKEPKLIFLDEPTIGLDPDGTNRMLDLICSLSREKRMTIFFSSHLLDQVQRVSDRVGIMIKGKLVAVGPIQELAKAKLGVDKEHYTLEELYMKYFKEA